MSDGVLVGEIAPQRNGHQQYGHQSYGHRHMNHFIWEEGRGGGVEGEWREERREEQ